MSTQAITKNDSIRRVFDEKTSKWYFCVMDSVGIASGSSDPRNYWKVLKSRLKKAGNKLVTECTQLKMKANDGKMYLTDVADAETTLKIVGLVAPEYAPTLENWFAGLDQENSQNFEKNSFKLHTIATSYPQIEFELLIDMYKENNFFVIKSFIAGAEIENIFISVTVNSVSIKGGRGISKEINQENSFVQELFWGNFSRTIVLPEEIEVNKVEVSEVRGLLTIRLPVLDKTKEKILKIKNPS